MLLKHHICLVTILFAAPHIASSSKTNARPVYEIINEHARMDDGNIRIASSPDILPYGNPLAGNSKQNARLHFNNQQAMFNAERMRQLTAQLQRQSKGPKHIDSYMQAYHESQDNHQIALEQQQANLRDQKQVYRSRQTAAPSKRVSQSNPVNTKVVNTNENRATMIKSSFGTRSQKSEASSKVLPLQRSEPMRTTKTGIKDIRYRNQRSYGSVGYHQYLEPSKYKTVYISPAPTYDQGVTIKPNANIGSATQDIRDQNKLLTTAISSDTKYVYPKQFQQMQNYKSIHETEAFKPILTNNPQEQISEFNSLLYPVKDIKNQIPIDIYFYLKDPSQSLAHHYDQHRYAQLANSYTGNYNVPENVVKDYTPITEEVDDIEDPDAKNPKAYTPLPQQTSSFKEQNTKNINSDIHNVKAEDQSIYTHETIKENDNNEEDKPTYQALQYNLPQYGENTDQSEKYYHHNSYNTGVQHLTEDGTGVSAYGVDNLHYAANYEFGYRVHDDGGGNYFGHSEAKSGENTNGHYHVLLPDGRMQNVKYYAGPEGFHADISYDHLR